MGTNEAGQAVLSCVVLLSPDDKGAINHEKDAAVEILYEMNMTTSPAICYRAFFYSSIIDISSGAILYLEFSAL
jgi:hypothetical protein